MNRNLRWRTAVASFVRYVIQGATVVLGNRSLWRYVWTPLLASAALFLVIAVLGYLAIVPLIASVVQRLGINAAQAELASSLLFVLLIVLTSGVLFVAVAGFLSSFLWERLSEEVERQVFGSFPKSRLGQASLVSDSLSRGFFSLSLAALGLCCGWLFFGIPGILIAGWIGLHDFTAPAFARRGVTFGHQRREVRRLKGWLEFLVACGVLTVIPLVNVIALPALVAGGTLMVRENEDNGALNTMLG